MAQVRYIGPHTEGVDLIPQYHAAQHVPWGEPVDLPDDVVHGQPPEEIVVNGQPDVIPGVGGLLEQGTWELVGPTTPAPEVQPETAQE